MNKIPVMEKIEVSSDNIVQLVHFRLGSQEYGIQVDKVKEILRIVEITPLPDLTQFLEGIINLREKLFR